MDRTSENLAMSRARARLRRQRWQWSLLGLLTMAASALLAVSATMRGGYVLFRWPVWAWPFWFWV